MCKRIQFMFFIILVYLVSCSESPTESDPLENLPLIEKLKTISDIQITEIAPESGFIKSFELVLKQPVDHNNPAAGQFSQRLYLHHTDETAPVVFLPFGYVSRSNYISELSPVLQANQIAVSHRYMGDARPYPTDWQHLNIEQAAADHHRIVEYFKKIYSGKWVSYGRSKNGMTALFHRRFYPEDVDATVAIVAPIVRGIDDPRFDLFLESVGTEVCRNRIKTYQRMLLENRDSILPMISSYMDNSTLTFNIDPGLILEYEVCEYPFAFWQYRAWECESIPGENATISELYQHLENADGFPLYSAESRDFYAPVYYQAYTELGWYRLINDPFADLLVSDPNPSYSFFTPPNTKIVFNPAVMQDIEYWLKNSGNNIVYIYGADDPWTAAAIELNGQTNALKIIQEDANHNITIAQLDDPGIVYAKLTEWLDIEITGPQLIITGDENEYRRYLK